MDTFLWVFGFVFLMLVLFSGESIICIVREWLHMKHTEKVIATLPEEERIKFVRTYLNDRVSLLNKIDKEFKETK